MDSTETTPAPDLDPSDIRRRVDALMKAERKSQAACGKEAGIAASTFAAWLGGTYKGNMDAVTDNVRRWLDSRDTRAQARATLPTAPGFIETESAGKYFRLLQHAQYAPELVALAGAPGTGKTMACDAYLERNPNVWRITGQPCFKTGRILLQDLADTLELGEQRGIQRTCNAIVRRLRNTSGLLIVDEAQHLSSEALDQLRTLHDLARIGVAMVGNETIYARLEGFGRSTHFAQIFSRVGMRMRRPRPTGADVDQLLDAWALHDDEARKLLHAIAKKPGALRNVTKSLRLAHMLAAADDGAELSARHVRMAWEQVSNERLVEA